MRLKTQQPQISETLNSFVYEYCDTDDKDKSLGCDFSDINIGKIHLKKYELLVVRNVVYFSAFDKSFNNCSSLVGNATFTQSGAPIFDKQLFIRGLILGGVPGVPRKDIYCKFVYMCRSKYYMRKLVTYFLQERKIEK